MTTLRLTNSQKLLLESIGKIITLGDRKAIFVPYIFVNHEDQPDDEVELIPLAEPLQKEWQDFQRLYDPPVNECGITPLIEFS